VAFRILVPASSKILQYATVQHFKPWVIDIMHPELKNTWTPAINVLTWFMLVTVILSVLTRLGTKYFFFRKFTTDDGFAAASMVFCIAQSIAVSLATSNGLGQHQDMLLDSRVDSMMKV
jgi:hypothetical protein